ncbi:MAG: hypothetical protein ACOCX9_06570 [Spirochaetota bacterium]
MELLINDHTVDFTLDSEKDTTDIITSVNEWAQERKLVFVSVIIDGTEYIPAEIPTFSLDEVKEINCIVQSVADIVVDSLKEGIAYCTRADGALDSLEDDGPLTEVDVNDLVDGLNWMREIVNSVISMLQLSPSEIRFRDGTVQEHFEKLSELITETQSVPVEEASDQSFLQRYTKAINDMVELFKIILMSEQLKDLIVQSIDSPDNLLKGIMELKDEMPEIAEKLEKASIAYQSGNDEEGAELLQDIMDFIYFYMRTCYQLTPVFGIDLKSITIDGESMDDINAYVNELLNEIVDVMENNDIISLSDILEYELKPQFEKLTLYLEKLLTELQSFS